MTNPTTEGIVYLELRLNLQGRLALSASLGLLVLLTCEEGVPSLEGAALFTEAEMTMLLPLLEQYPNYCPNEVLLASFRGKVTERTVERARSELNEALDHGGVYSLMRPIRNMVSRTRLKLHTLNIDVVNLHETGYAFRPLQEKLRKT